MNSIITPTAGKFKEDIDKRYTFGHSLFKEGYGERVLIKQREEFEKYLNTYMNETSKHIQLVKDSYQRKM